MTKKRLCVIGIIVVTFLGIVATFPSYQDFMGPNGQIIPSAAVAVVALIDTVLIWYGFFA